ncbi:MAG: hypothetical protein HY716_04970 [Planctomycetes bacterium]|nr:hypothetical protein [Planctomycetota bacterium]
MRLSVSRALALHLLWTAFTCGALLIAIGGVLPFRLGAIDPPGAFSCLVESEIFFILVVWPFFIPRLCVAAKDDEPMRTLGETPLLLSQVAVMFVVALPAALLSRNLADVGTLRFFFGLLLVGVLACFTAAVFLILGPRRATSSYFLGFFVCSALLPFCHYLSGEFAGGPSLAFLAALSPFWSAAQLRPGAPLSWAPAATCAIYGALALLLLASAPFLKTPAPADSSRA